MDHRKGMILLELFVVPYSQKEIHSRTLWFCDRCKYTIMLAEDDFFSKAKYTFCKM